MNIGKGKNNEEIIVSITTWSARIQNLPKVLDTIFNQTLQPDKVVVNLAFDEFIPADVQTYINQRQIEVFRTEDTKVYKKFLPTLLRYPEACVINIDDDLLYPTNMIEDFYTTHVQHPGHPVCGNHMVCCGMMCHCGEASLTKYEYFGTYLQEIDNDLMQHCTSSDIVFSYLAAKNRHPYIPAEGYYGTYYQEIYNDVASYTANIIKENGVKSTFEYMLNRFGKLDSLATLYEPNAYSLNIIEYVGAQSMEELISEWQEKCDLAVYEASKKIRASKAYRIGSICLSPFKFVKSILHK